MKRSFHCCMATLSLLASAALHVNAATSSQTDSIAMTDSHHQYYTENETTAPAEYDSPAENNPAIDNQSEIWKYNKRTKLGFIFSTLDRKSRLGGEITSKWGIDFQQEFNIFLHRRPIAGFLRFGLDIAVEFDYINYGGNLFNGLNFGSHDDGEVPELGHHYLTAGLAVGPTATFAPFFGSSNRNLAALRFRPYFHVTPSYASYLVSEDGDTEMHNAFALWCAAGLEIQWKRLVFGVGWKGSTAKYKGLMDSLMDKWDEDYESDHERYKFDNNMIILSIGVGF